MPGGVGRRRIAYPAWQRGQPKFAIGEEDLSFEWHWSICWRTPLVWPVNLLLRILTKWWDSDGEAQQCIHGIRDDNY
jgi:hypothetical protein